MGCSFLIGAFLDSDFFTALTALIMVKMNPSSAYRTGPFDLLIFQIVFHSQVFHHLEVILNIMSVLKFPIFRMGIDQFLSDELTRKLIAVNAEMLFFCIVAAVSDFAGPLARSLLCFIL